MRGTFEPAAAKAAGVNTEKLLVSQPDNNDQAFEILDRLVRSGAIDLIVTCGRLDAAPMRHLRGCAARTETEIRKC